MLETKGKVRIVLIVPSKLNSSFHTSVDFLVDSQIKLSHAITGKAKAKY